MKLIKNSIILLVLIIALYSCKKNPRCDGEDKIKGIITQSMSLPWPDVKEEGYVVNSELEFRALFDSTSNPTNIDFNTNTLLGLMASGGGCDIKFVKDVKRKEKDKLYHYKVKVRSCGLCKQLGSGINWVLVPKLPDDWEVTFEVD